MKKEEAVSFALNASEFAEVRRIAEVILSLREPEPDGDDLTKQVFEEGRKIRDAERKRAQPRSRKKPQARS